MVTSCDGVVNVQIGSVSPNRLTTPGALAPRQDVEVCGRSVGQRDDQTTAQALAAATDTGSMSSRTVIATTPAPTITARIARRMLTAYPPSFQA